MKNSKLTQKKKTTKEEDGSVDSLGKIPSGPLRKRSGNSATAKKFLKFVKK